MTLRDAGRGDHGEAPTTTRDSGKRRSALLVLCIAVAIALCAWGSVGWRRAYQAQAVVDGLVWAEQVRDGELLRYEVRGAEAAAQLALEGRFDAIPPVFLVDGQ